MRTFRPRWQHPALVDVSAERIADICKIHVTTARRWKRGEEPPHAAIQWIRAVTAGDLGVLDAAFTGWRLRDGKILTPEGVEATPGDIRSLPFLRQMIAHYQTNERYESQADWVDERWCPWYELEARKLTDLAG